jgi:hypothetical protein
MNDTPLRKGNATQLPEGTLVEPFRGRSTDVAHTSTLVTFSVHCRDLR